MKQSYKGIKSCLGNVIDHSLVYIHTSRGSSVPLGAGFLSGICMAMSRYVSMPQHLIMTSHLAVISL